MKEYIKLIKIYFNENKFVRYSIKLKIVKKLLKKNIYKYKKNEKINCKIEINPLKKIKIIERINKDNYLMHKFNFLGTGWRFWGNRIEWKKDIKSGFRFTDQVYSPVLIDNLPHGVDIKIPWELGRMQHWPQLSLFAVQNPQDRKKIVLEFKKQVEEFIETNPVGHGVQFYCAMEIAIRAINILLSYDILRQLEPDMFPDKFEKKMEDNFNLYFYEIVGKLEKNLFNNHTGNHYLANLVGLLWLCMYFDNLQKKWGQSIIDELKKEVKKQFLDDGANFECSTGYHVLATELLLLGLIAIRKIDSTINIDYEKKILAKALNVLGLFIDKKGCLIQIGDFDSGRVLKLSPQYIGNVENCLQVRDLQGLIDYNRGSIIDCNTYVCLLDSYGVVDLVENDFVKMELFSGIRHDTINFDYKNAKFKNRYKINIDVSCKIKEIYSLNEFGLIKLVLEEADVFIRCVPEYKKMDISHAHNDVFNYTIITSEGVIGGDLGSIVYTSDSKTRFYFAGHNSHNVPIHENEILHRRGLFDAETNAYGRYCLTNNKIIVFANWNGDIWHVREFEFHNTSITIYDYSNDEFKINITDDKYVSFGYGQLYRRKNNEFVGKN